MTVPAGDTAALTAAAQAMTVRTLTLSVKTSTFGNRRKASLGDVTVKADKSLLSLHKQLIDSPELDAIKTFDSRTETLLKKYAAGPSLFRAGFIPVSTADIPVVDALILERKALRQGLVDAAVAAYRTRVDETLARLEVLGRPSDYPSVEQFAASFEFTHDWLSWTTPDELRRISPSIFERQVAQHQAELARVADEARQGVRAMFQQIVAHLADRLKPDAEGEKKILQTRTVEKLTAFLDAFETGTKNPTNDEAFAPLIAQARALMDGTTPALLKDDVTIRAHVAAQLDALLADIQPLVATRDLIIRDDDEETQAATAPDAGSGGDRADGPADDRLDDHVLGRRGAAAAVPAATHG